MSQFSTLSVIHIRTYDDLETRKVGVHMIDFKAIFGDDVADTTSPAGSAAASDEVQGGRRLLETLRRAGYSLQIQRSTATPSGYVIIPLGEATPSKDLLELYDRCHDEAMRYVLRVCESKRIDPLDYRDSLVEKGKPIAKSLDTSSGRIDFKQRGGRGQSRTVCRCGSTQFRDYVIHDGKSVRRDCAICGRFIAFPVWHGPSLDELKGTSTGTNSDGETVEGVLTEKQALLLLCNDS